ncbi:unnamed protein product [Sphagnum balticum]
MGMYFCRVGTDDGADTEPASGSEDHHHHHPHQFYMFFITPSNDGPEQSEAAQATKTTLCAARELQKVERDYSRTWKTGKKHSCFQRPHDTLLVSI